MRFVIRVYGLLFNENNQLLVCDEFRFGQYMTKFPGGGLEFGEGPEDCLKREIREEMGQEVVEMKHFYTTGFFQKAALIHDDAQLISIYYTIQIRTPENIITTQVINNIPPIEEAIAFRWVNLDETDESHFNFPIDRIVFNMLKKSYRDKTKAR